MSRTPAGQAEALQAQVGAVVAHVDAHRLEEWWVGLFDDAMLEPARGEDDDVTPMFAYLILLDVLDLPAFFASIAPTAVEEGLLNAVVDIEHLDDGRLRPGLRYRVTATLAEVEAKHGRQLGDFQLVTIESRISGVDEPCEILVRNRIAFCGIGA